MKKYILLIVLLFFTSCFGGDKETVDGTEVPKNDQIVQENTNTTNPSNTTPEGTGTGTLPNIADLQEVETYEEIVADDSWFNDKYIVKNKTLLSKSIIDSVVFKCKYFDGEVNYTYESGEKVEFDQPFELQSFLYEAIEEGWCPGNETKEEKYAMADQLLSNQVPEKMTQLKDIKSIDDIDIEKLNFDTSKPGYKREILTFLALYMVTLDESDVEEYNRYLGYYNDLVVQISEEEGRGNEELYYPILIATSQKPGGCSKYIEENIVSYN